MAGMLVGLESAQSGGGTVFVAAGWIDVATFFTMVTLLYPAAPKPLLSKQRSIATVGLHHESPY